MLNFLMESLKSCRMHLSLLMLLRSINVSISNCSTQCSDFHIVTFISSLETCNVNHPNMLTISMAQLHSQLHANCKHVYMVYWV